MVTLGIIAFWSSLARLGLAFAAWMIIQSDKGDDTKYDLMTRKIDWEKRTQEDE